MKICILGVCGAFMANIANLAQALGHHVVGYDVSAYPPMSTYLSSVGIEVMTMPKTPVLPPDVDCVIVGNTVRKDSAWATFLTEGRVPYQSGPEWLYEAILKDRQVIAVGGTHGKTTTTTMIVSILRSAGLNPGYLIGGVPIGLESASAVGDGPYFVIEADEYSTAFFDPDPKFLHYHPSYWIVNNLEFDHADIFATVTDIANYLQAGLKQLPDQGTVIYHTDSPLLPPLIEPLTAVRSIACGNNHEYRVSHSTESGNQFSIVAGQHGEAVIDWTLMGEHNKKNALSAVSLCVELGVPATLAGKTLSAFSGVKRRMESLGTIGGVHVYDDFAHHPSSIVSTVDGARARFPNARVIALIHLVSNTMKRGLHDQGDLLSAFNAADCCICLSDNPLPWVHDCVSKAKHCHFVCTVADALAQLQLVLTSGDILITMGNKDFRCLHEGLHAMLLPSEGTVTDRLT